MAPNFSLLAACLLTTVAVILLVLAIYAAHSQTVLSLPLPGVAPILSILLPIAYAVLLWTLKIWTKLNSTVTQALTWILSLIAAALFALSSTHLAPEIFDCSFESAWLRWYRIKAPDIRAIQDRLQCCGLRSTVDRAWPFPDNTHEANACTTVYGRSDSCWDMWRAQGRVALVIYVGISVICLALQTVVMLYFVLSPGSFWPRRHRWTEQQGQQRLLHDGSAYRDDENEAGSEQANEQHA